MPWSVDVLWYFWETSAKPYYGFAEVFLKIFFFWKKDSMYFSLCPKECFYLISWRIKVIRIYFKGIQTTSVTSVTSANFRKTGVSDAGDDLDFDLLPEYVSICLKKNENGCKHRCMHMQIKLANLLIINCRELRHIHFNNALVMDEIKDDPASVLRCLVKNCSNECYHMISTEGIKR